MKVTGLLLIALGFISHVSAHQDYQLQCSREEMGIRWPSYRSNSEYYVCHRLGDRPMIVNCNNGEIFTFVLQVCTSPSRYIPAPALDVLPTSSPIGGAFPLGGHPPVLGAGHHTNIQDIPHPPMVVVDPPRPPTVTVTNSDHKNDDTNIEVQHKPPHPAKPHHPAAKPPMPPTPAPTPPLVDSVATPKKPHAPLAKKPSSPKKTPSKKTPPKSGKGSKKTKPTDAKTSKKTPKKTPKKAPKKAPKKPVTLTKKTPKAPKSPKAPKAPKIAKTITKA